MWSALFPGQGSQFPGMGKFLYEDFVVVRRLFEEASDALSLNIKKLCFDSAESDLALTENAQPCLLLSSVAMFRILNDEFGFNPTVAAGHSVGEYAAVVSAGAVQFSDGMRAVRIRGEAMQAAVPIGQGGMTAVIGLTQDQVVQLCRWAEETSGQTPIEPANINAPGQIVISGRKVILDWIPTAFKSDMFADSPRVKFIPLKVSAPFHCSMMKPAQETMATVLDGLSFSPAHFPVVQNVNGLPATEGEDLRRGLIEQVVAPVRWIECVEKVRDLGGVRAVEVGPGKVLAGLVKKIDSEGVQIFSVNSLDELKALAKELEGKT